MMWTVGGVKDGWVEVTADPRHGLPVQTYYVSCEEHIQHLPYNCPPAVLGLIRDQLFGKNEKSLEECREEERLAEATTLIGQLIKSHSSPWRSESIERRELRSKLIGLVAEGLRVRGL